MVILPAKQDVQPTFWRCTVDHGEWQRSTQLISLNSRAGDSAVRTTDGIWGSRSNRHATINAMTPDAINVHLSAGWNEGTEALARPDADCLD